MKRWKCLLSLIFLLWNMNMAMSQQRKAAKVTTATKVKPKTSQMQRSISSSNTSKSMKEATTAATRGPARDPNAPIEVVGQSRNLNMLLILQNPNEEINFVKPRTDYKKEIENMNY